MPVNAAEFLLETNELKPDELAAYFLLLLNMWARGGSLPNDPERLARFARVDRAIFDILWLNLGKLFDATPECLSQKRLTLQYEEVRLAKQVNVVRAQKGGKGLAGKRKEQLLLAVLEAPPEAVLSKSSQAGLEHASSSAKHVSATISAQKAGSTRASDQGSGSETPLLTKRNSDSDSPLFSGILRTFSAVWSEIYFEEYIPDSKDRAQLGRLLRSIPSAEKIRTYDWEGIFRAYLADMSIWNAEEHRHSLSHFVASGGLNKYRTKAPTVGYSARELRGKQSGEKFEQLISKLPGGVNGRAR